MRFNLTGLCYCVSSDMLTDHCIPKQSHNLLTEFPASSDVSLLLNFSASSNVLILSFIGKSFEQVVALKVNCTIVC
jgi:hypothetical protein